MNKFPYIIVFFSLLFVSLNATADITIRNDSDYTISYGLIQGYQYTSGGVGTNVILRGYWPRLRPGASYTYNNSDYAGSSSFVFSYLQIAPDNRTTGKFPRKIDRDSRIVRNVSSHKLTLPSKMSPNVRSSKKRNDYLALYNASESGIASLSRRIMGGGRVFDNVPSITFEIPDPRAKRNLRLIVTNEDLYIRANTFR
ncbi:MAG: hypothetical protein KAS66_16330 [Candidatus Omnitrophica bacterium]|nr:hypothetical protein [Candidatus Omnitrophota bacterium]